MGILPEREPAKKSYENIDEASPLNIERKEVASSVPSRFKAKVTDDQGNKLIESVDDRKFTINIPQIGHNQMIKDIKDGDKEDAFVWSIAYWLRMFKKALFFGWKVIFNK